VTIAAVIGTLLLAAEFSFAPFNLWRGRTMENFTMYTGLPPRFATHFLAPVKLVTALLLVAGLFLRPASVAGAVLAMLISGFYLVRLAAPGRRDPAGLTAFILFGALACALLALRLMT
jgi:uncharacterized membrane protein YphA (DoxX/SURF4 family)